MRIIPWALAVVVLWSVGSLAIPSGVFPGATWDSATPASQDLDPDALDAAMAYLASESGSAGVERALVVRHGYVVWDGGDTDHKQNTWSVTKVFVSTALGLLVDEGSCTVDDLAADYVRELSANYPDLTLGHLATMTSGYDAVGGAQTSTPFDPTTPMFSPGDAHAYWDAATNQFGNVVTRIAQEPLVELFKREIADVIGMDPARWSWGDWGSVGGFTVNGGAGNKSKGISTTARQLARFGLLYLNLGEWDGQQLLSPSWVVEATSVHVGASVPRDPDSSSSHGPGVFGYNWWVNGIEPDGERFWPGAPLGTYQAIGYNNNRLAVIPEWDMLVVRLGTDGSSFDHDEFSTFVSWLGQSVLSSNLFRGTSPTELLVHETDIDRCFEDDAGTLENGQAYYYVVEEYGGPTKALTVDKVTGNSAVRICVE